ncbi:hypothetical protein ACOJBO_01870 [Rhizobium beringeri]
MELGRIDADGSGTLAPSRVPFIGIIKRVDDLDEFGGALITFFRARQRLSEILFADGGCHRIPTGAPPLA